MWGDPRFVENYVPVVVEVDEPMRWRGTIWIHRWSAKIGIRGGAGDQLQIPAYLLANGDGATARNAESGAFQLLLQPGAAARLDVSADVVELDPQSPNVQIELLGDEVVLRNRGARAVHISALLVN